ncbi:MAG: hypothetical protein K8S98_08420 [Planctomycetes bacterium]|nr:hypothetical protein [Planctomycetota bacterium]
MPRTILAVAFALCTSCAAVNAPFRSADPLAATPATQGFPSQKLDGLIFAAARWDAQHDEVFGLDLVRAADVLPIAVTACLRGDGQDRARAWLNPERMAPELFLADGTALAALTADEVTARVPERYGARLKKLALGTGLMTAHADEGWLFFELAPRGAFDVGERTIAHTSGERTSELDLRASLVAFQVTLDGREQSVCVGVGR